MNKESITLKEFLAIVVAGTMITAALYQTNQPVGAGKGAALTATPRFAMQFTTDPKGELYQRPREPGYESANAYNSYAVPPVAQPRGGMGNLFSAMWQTITALWGGTKNAMPELQY